MKSKPRIFKSRFTKRWVLAYHRHGCVVSGNTWQEVFDWFLRNRHYLAVYF